MGPLVNKQMVCIAYSLLATFGFDYAYNLSFSFLPNASFTSAKWSVHAKTQTAWHHLPRKYFSSNQVIFLLSGFFVCSQDTAPLQ